MITKDCIESAYCFCHQKWNIYSKSTMDWQKDDIEYAIASYVDGMDTELYAYLSAGNTEFLRDHTNFASDIQRAIVLLEQMMESK
ncbi:MAG: hypothetical protein MJ204_06220 [Bacteroidales bacterium]|nr:hypothetical protein [Bacteroidales bacterium]